MKTSNLALLLAIFVALAIAVTVKGQATCSACPSGFICVNGACAKPCDNPAHNNLQGLCTGGTDPFAGVYCNSYNEGSDKGILETDRFNVKSVTTGSPVPCSEDADCDKYGTGYFCDYFTPKNSSNPDKPQPQCVKPAAPACFPLIPVTWKSQYPCPPNCPP